MDKIKKKKNKTQKNVKNHHLCFEKTRSLHLYKNNESATLNDDLCHVWLSCEEEDFQKV